MLYGNNGSWSTRSHVKIQCDLDWKILCLPCRTQVKWRSNGAAKNPKGTTKSGRFLWGFPNPKPLNPGKVCRISAERWDLTSFFFRIFGVFAGLVESFVFSASWLSHRNLGAWGFPLVVILQRSVCVYAFFEIYTMYYRIKYQFQLIKADLSGGTLEAYPPNQSFGSFKAWSFAMLSNVRLFRQMSGFEWIHLLFWLW